MALSPTGLMVPTTVNPSELFGPPPTADLFDDEPSSCAHLAEACADAGAKSRMLHVFAGAVAWRAQRLHDNVHAPKRRKLGAPQCGVCKRTTARLLVCLQCAFAGCWQDEHAIEHLVEDSHYFAVDINTGAVFCTECDDFVYEPGLDAAFRDACTAVNERNSHFLADKKRREAYRKWVASPKDIAALESTTTIPCQSRRGLLNLGQTCFLNVVLQSFVHNPLLRNHFLSDKHNHLLCENMECTSCEMDKLFTAVYTPGAPPFGPTGLLSAIWQANGGLAGYAQHDAHECLIALLNALHASARGSTEVACNCVVHAAFGGQLQSELRCARCAHASRTPEACFDVSLGLGDGAEPDTLAGCLARFTQPEKLGPKDYSCPKCGKTPGEASKRMSILKLPPVLSFQFKRFEQTGGEKGTARKISTPVRIPSMINMAPYTSAAQAATPKPDPVTFAHPGPESIYDYDLFAVINHEGEINTGHYTNFARFEDDWYRFDDDKVTPTTLSAVLGSPVPIYMACYVKRELDYQPASTPSYILARESEIERERQEQQAKVAERARALEERDREVHDELLQFV